MVKSYGGSRAYGLNTPDSDTDIRGVFVNTEVSQILGLNRFDHQINKKDKEDTVLVELRQFFKNLKKGCTGDIELLWTEPDSIITPSYNWGQILKYRTRLVSTNTLFKSISGYLTHERELAFGEKTKNQKILDNVKNFGYNPKSVVQFCRLAWCATEFFKKGVFPVNLGEYQTMGDSCVLVYDFLYKVKNTKTSIWYGRDRIIEKMNEFESEFYRSFQAKNFCYEFDDKIVSEICFCIYYDILDTQYVGCVGKK